MNLAIGHSFSLTDISPADRAAYLVHLQEKQIYDQTLNIPHPYTEESADWWIDFVAEETRRQGRSVNWAIRDGHGYLVGGIGFHGLEVGKTHRGELGYWLAKPYWGRGIMTSAVRSVSEYSFSDLGLVRVTAHVFDFNVASARVLEKAGFQCEGRLRKHYKKDGAIFDGLLYARVR
jgi:[ribosomal protein S5]-alanine N-acetyltransferase